MKRKWSGTGNNMATTRQIAITLLLLCIASACDGSRRTAQRRKDTSLERDYYQPAPSVETLSSLAEETGAAGFEHYTEGKALVKRLIPERTEPDLDLIRHDGVIGKAGVDFPAFPNIPPTGFNCKNVPTGYYADLETDCQVFHICDTSRKISFLCPNGTIFSQSHLICDWWFKVDCASAPALYESSAEYYSNEQKKSQKITQSLSKTLELPQISSDASNIQPSKTPLRRTTLKDLPTSTTERLLRHRQRLQSDNTPPLGNPKPTSRSFQSLFTESNYNPTQKTVYPPVPSGFEKRRKLVQLIGNNFANTPRPTLPTYTDAATYRNPAPSGGDFNTIKEMQVAAESASFANNNNRQFLQDYTKNFRPYPVYTPNVPAVRVGKAKANPTLTTLFEIRNKNVEQQQSYVDSTTKRATLLPYTKSYSNTINEKQPYTRPGVSLLKEFLEREKNKTATTTEKITTATDRADHYSTKDTYETVTKIPHTTRSDSYFTDTASSIRYDVFSTNNFHHASTEPNYQERRERLLRKLNLDSLITTEPTVTTTDDKQYGKRPGLVVPPSLTPKTLHTLAIYYATALDNLSTTTPVPDAADAETTTTAIDDYEMLEDGLPALFSRHTINKYSKLFGQHGENSDLLEEIRLDPNGTYNELTDDLAVMQSQNPLATSPQIRELAQVFTHALSAYLQDPVQFRKVLSNIRPTEPSFGEVVTATEESVYNTETTTTINEEDDEILGFSDENKARPALAQLRDGKSLNPSTVYPVYNTETDPPTTKAIETTTTPQPTTPASTLRSIFRCCGRISASYTTAATPREYSVTHSSYSNTVASNVNTLASNYGENLVTTTENSYAVPRYGGFQNNTQESNDSPYGKGVNPTGAQPLNEYVENTNLPTAWGIDASDVTSLPITSVQLNEFESKKIKPTTYSPPTTTPVYFTEKDTSGELENEEELQRAHSQSFVSPQDNSLRQGKNINFDAETKTTVKKPAEELEAPTISDQGETTTILPTTSGYLPTTTSKNEDNEAPTTYLPEISSIFTSPDSDKSTNIFQWSNNFENWQSTVVLDPMTLNDGLSENAPHHGLQSGSQTTAWAGSFNTATTPVADYTGTVEQEVSSSQFISQTTPANRVVDDSKRKGRLLNPSTSTESNQDLTTIAETVVEKAKEIMGGMNATTTEKLMNVMKKTKSKTVRRLILLLVQTCDDDHNSTAEASKKALLEALMAVSQKDMDEMAKEQEELTQTTIADYDSNLYTNTHRRTDKTLETVRAPSRVADRRGKSINFDPSAINSLSNPSTTQAPKTTEAIVETTVSNTTPTPFTRTTPANRRGTKKFLTKSSNLEIKTTVIPFDAPTAAARISAGGSEVKTVSDTRAIELLRSLYSIAAKWG
ncbi:unnamed protein product [Plutella xylostella]|uniref:(diamondback moth) hypothetical protein n=1 Tax=Plutella xylostella TaxID=51655 RepID=A0A8S4FWL2_PLUXY|nr:unnamed protein product [Plutella xylostella]